MHRKCKTRATDKSYVTYYRGEIRGFLWRISFERKYLSALNWTSFINESYNMHRSPAKLPGLVTKRIYFPIKDSYTKTCHLGTCLFFKFTSCKLEDVSNCDFNVVYSTNLHQMFPAVLSNQHGKNTIINREITLEHRKNNAICKAMLILFKNNSLAITFTVVDK